LSSGRLAKEVTDHDAHAHIADDGDYRGLRRPAVRKRLPEVGRSLGKGIVEFKKGIRGIDDEVDEAANRQASRTLPDEKPAPKQVAAAPQYKFDPYTGKPIEEAKATEEHEVEEPANR